MRIVWLFPLVLAACGSTTSSTRTWGDPADPDAADVLGVPVGACSTPSEAFEMHGETRFPRTDVRRACVLERHVLLHVGGTLWLLPRPGFESRDQRSFADPYAEADATVRTDGSLVWPSRTPGGAPRCIVVRPEGEVEELTSDCALAP